MSHPVIKSISIGTTIGNSGWRKFAVGRDLPMGGTVTSIEPSDYATPPIEYHVYTNKRLRYAVPLHAVLLIGY